MEMVGLYFECKSGVIAEFLNAVNITSESGCALI